VDEGLGKEKMSVILEDDDTLQIIKVSSDKARAIQRHEIDLNGSFGQLIDDDALYQAIISVYNQVDADGLDRLLSVPIAPDEHFNKNLFSKEFLFQMLLKISAQLKQSVTDMQDKTVKDFFEILIKISEQSKAEGIAEGKNMIVLQKEIVKQWENLIDKSQKKNSNFYSPKEYLVDGTYTDEESDQALNTLFKRASTRAIDAVYVDSEYVQNQNSYLSGLPLPDTSGTAQVRLLKQLQYWERYIIPKTVDHMIRYKVQQPGSAMFTMYLE
jgi:hypothetical protein